jgi:hypothetical protein
MPPRPNIRSGPSLLSRVAPRITSAPSVACCCTTIVARGSCARAFAIIPVERLGRRIGRVDPYAHAADIGLVHDHRRAHLGNDREPERRRRRSCFLGGARLAPAQNRKAGKREQLLRFHQRQLRAAIGTHRGHQ